MWMDNPEKAADAYRAWLETWIEVAEKTEDEEEAGYLSGLKHALRGFKQFFGGEVDKLFPISEEEWRRIVRAIEKKRDQAKRFADADQDPCETGYYGGEIWAYDDVLDFFYWWEHERLEENASEG